MEHFSFIPHLVSILVLAATSRSIAAPTTVTARSKATYYLTNCFLSTNTITQHAEIDYYSSTPKFFPASKPELVSVLNPTESINYEDSTFTTLPGSPFNLVVVIGEDVYTAKAGTVGSATGTSVKRTLRCLRLTRTVVYESGDTVCYADYACT